MFIQCETEPLIYNRLHQDFQRMVRIIYHGRITITRNFFKLFIHSLLYKHTYIKLSFWKPFLLHSLLWFLLPDLVSFVLYYQEGSPLYSKYLIVSEYYSVIFGKNSIFHFFIFQKLNSKLMILRVKSYNADTNPQIFWLEVFTWCPSFPYDCSDLTFLTRISCWSHLLKTSIFNALYVSHRESRPWDPNRPDPDPTLRGRSQVRDWIKKNRVRIG